MKPTCSRQVFVALSLCLLACEQQPAALGDAERAEIVAQVTARQTELVGTFEALDAAAAAELQSADNFLAYASLDGYLDRQTLVDSMAVWFGERETEQFDPTTLNVYPLTSELALADVVADGRVVMKDGTEWEGRNVITYVWKKELAGWYIIHQSESWRYNRVDEETPAS